MAEIGRRAALCGLERVADGRAVLSPEAGEGAGELKELAAAEAADLEGGVEG
jgi:hypothetical protein